MKLEHLLSCGTIPRTGDIVYFASMSHLKEIKACIRPVFKSETNMSNALEILNVTFECDNRYMCSVFNLTLGTLIDGLYYAYRFTTEKPE